MRRDDLDFHARRFDADDAKLIIEKPTELRCVASELPGVSRGLHGGRVLGEPSLQRRSELEDREKKGHEQRDRKGRLERGEPPFVASSVRQRTDCIWLTSA